MKRVVLFLATNVAVLAVIYVVLNVLGIDRALAQNGSTLNLGALLAFSAVVGFSGSLVSLAMSKWIARMTTGARVHNRAGGLKASEIKARDGLR